MHYASSVSEEVSNTYLKIEKSYLAWMNQCWQEKKKVNCCRTWLELDPFCSLQGVWKAEIIIPGHKGQRNKSRKYRRNHSRVQRGGKNSPLVCTFMQWCRYTDRAAQKALRYGTSRWIKEINCKDVGNRAMPIKGQSHRPPVPVQGHFAAGFLEQWYAGHQMQSKPSVFLPLL